MTDETIVTLAAVEEAAFKKNGWVAFAVIRFDPDESERQNGYVLFERPSTTFEPEYRYGGAAWARGDDGIPFFFRGSYDLTRDAALEALRVERR